MKTETFGPLYAKASTGKIKTWQITAVLEEDGRVNLNTLHGYENGELSSSSKQINGKNIGRSNETTPWNQALSDAASKLRKKMDEGYVPNKAELEEQALLLPMLALSYKDRSHDIEWPAYVQPKLNGARCLTRMTENGPEYISRKGKLYTNLSHLNTETEELIDSFGVPLDGEIFVKDWGFQEIIRALKKDRGEVTDKLEYWVYDIVAPNETFQDRSKVLYIAAANRKGKFKNIRFVETHRVQNEQEMMEWHKKFTADGFEGTIIRNAKGKYCIKNRSKDLQKYKDMKDEEYIITGVHEATGNDIGTAVFELETKEGLKFSARSKGSRELRREYLNNINSIIGKYATVQYQELSEAPQEYKEGVPIFPVILCIRDYE
jgi:DNA ligase 1